MLLMRSGTALRPHRVALATTCVRPPFTSGTQHLRQCVIKATSTSSSEQHTTSTSTKESEIFQSLLHQVTCRNNAVSSTLASDSSHTSSAPTTEANNNVSELPSTPVSARISKLSLESKTKSDGRGLYFTGAEPIPGRAEILLNIPLDSCLIVDYTEGVRLPNEGKWPRVQRGLSKDDALPWDIVLALALLDGLAGDGGDFWSMYTNYILPPPKSMTLPVCLPKDLLLQLEHPEIIENALQQKQRLSALFPGLSVPACDDEPSWLEWAFACVRSRAFRISSDEVFAFVPFVDTANHALEPNSNFELSVDRHTVNLVSLKEIKQGEEITISYTGTMGYTNQRLMAQYGFSMPNPFDRIWFSPSDGNNEKDSVLLSLDALQEVLGDGDDMVAAFSGKDTYTYAALKSLPLASMESDAAPMVDQITLARVMLKKLEAEAAQWKTSIEQDEVILLKQEQDSLDAVEDPRHHAVVNYRLHRKRMITAGIKLLKAFSHHTS